MTSAKLKYIAICTMLIDHIGATLLTEYIILRIIGRIAFPIFAFLIAQGYIHTKDVKKYLVRLFLFGLISEIPFDLAFKEKIFSMEHQNVFFTLFLGLLTIYLYDRFKYHNSTIAALSIIGTCITAVIFSTDYAFFGVLTTFFFYKFKDNFSKQFVSIAIINITMCLLFIEKSNVTLSSFTQLYALLAFIPIYYYNGIKGRTIKYIFYFFYPVHLLVLYLLI